MSPPTIVTLTTDFGLSDSYVAVMKGVILGIAPDVQIVDISHDVAPQDVIEGGFLLRTAYRYFAASAVHVAVVDPGVGTTRRPIAIRACHGQYVGPDNGILSAPLLDQGALESETGALREAVGVELTNPAYRLTLVSQTFHGRDIFAPAAAHLAAGVPLEALGDPIPNIVVAATGDAIDQGGVISGEIIHVDRFGNAITNVPSALIPPAPVLQVSDREIRGVSSSYQDAAVVAVVGSSGMVEISVRNGSASEELGLRRGDELTIRSME